MFCVRQSSVRGCRFSFVFVYFVIKVLNVRRFPPPSSHIYQLHYSDPDVGNLEMLDFALSQATSRTAPLLPPEEAGEENPMFLCFFSATGPRASGTHFLKERAISFSSGFSGPWDDSVRCPASSLSPTTHLAIRVRFGDAVPPHAPLASPVWDPGSSARMPQNLPPSVPSSPTPLRCTTTVTSIAPLEPFARRLEAWLTQPSPSGWLTRTIRLGYAIQFARRPPKFNGVLETSGGSPERPCLVRGDCWPPGKGCNRAGPSSRDEAGVSQPLLHHTLERWSPTNPGSASLEPGFAQAPVQGADAQAHDQMHPAPGLVCSDRPEGHIHSCFDPSATQTISTVSVRGSGMTVQGPPPRALPISPSHCEGRRVRPYPATGSERQCPQLP